MNEIIISGVIATESTEEELLNELIDWVESKNMYFGGNVKQCTDEHYNNIDKLFDEQNTDDKLEAYLHTMKGYLLFEDEKNELLNYINLRDSRDKQMRNVAIINNYLVDNYGLQVQTKRIKVNGKSHIAWVISEI